MFYFFIGKTIPKSNLRFAAPRKQAVTKQKSPTIHYGKSGIERIKPKSIHFSFLIQEISKAQSNQPTIKERSVDNLLNAIKGRIATDQ